MACWWDEGDYTLCLGVFQGGGAKGAAYAGALKAVAESRHWFSQVAGASAGAITAALVASGVTPDRLEELGKAGLSTLRWRWVGVLAGQAKALLDNAGLGRWLEGVLREQVGGPADQPVSFAELQRATGIACHIVVLDLATTAPIVFCAASTPNASVTDAVLASSAIPAALDPGRAIIPPGKKAVTHHLVDGGGWANLPTFIFRDEAWRRWAFGDAARAAAAARADHHPEFWRDLDPEPPGDLLLCFTLNPKGVDHVRPLGLLRHTERSGPQFDLGTGRSARSFRVVTASWVLGSILRIIPLVAVVVAAGLFIDRIPEALLDLNESLRKHTGPLWPLLFTLSSLALLLGSALATVLFLGLFAIGLPLALSVLPTIRATLSVATSPPPWTGEHEHSRHIAIPVTKLTTLSFTAPAEEAIKSGYETAKIAMAWRVAQPQPAQAAPATGVHPVARSVGWVETLARRWSRPAQAVTGALDRVFDVLLSIPRRLSSALQRDAGAADPDRQRLLERFAHGWLRHTVVAFLFYAPTMAAVTYALMQTARGEGLLWTAGGLVLAAVLLFIGVLALQGKAYERATGEAKRIGSGTAALALAGMAGALAVMLVAGFAARDEPIVKAEIVRVEECVERSASGLRAPLARSACRRTRAEIIYTAEREDGAGRAIFQSSINLGVEEPVVLREDDGTRLYGFPETLWFVVSALAGLALFGGLLFGLDDFRYPRVRDRLHMAIARHTCRGGH